MKPDERIGEELKSLGERDMLRSLRTLPAVGGKFTLDGREVLNFSSNDYLNLASSAELKAAAVEAIEKYGCGATASRLMGGHHELHERLEGELARVVGGEAALVFGSGFLTNLGVLGSLSGKGDTVYSDQLNHASLIDGIRLSRADSRPYRHRDLAHLEELLGEDGGDGRRIIVSDSVFSMDGDVAPVEGLAELAERFGAMLIVDEAHAIGVFGESGAGVCKSLGVRPDVVTGTLSKALGGYGGFTVCSRQTRDLLINRARTFFYSTGLPPASAATALAAIAKIESDDGLGARLLEKARSFRALLAGLGLDAPELVSQIVVVIIGDNQPTLEISQTLWDARVLATPIRPPTVPGGTARLRLSVTLAHTDADLERAAEEIAAAAREAGVL